ncbi:MAG: hypothetical protein KF844_03885 [Cryobacterium sp.]|nr:hypothetical protein [Cryobacterium sp.]
MNGLFTFFVAAIGVVGGIAGIASFVWQVITWRRSTHSVKASTARSWIASGDGRISEEMVSVTARNTGTAAVTVTGWGIELGRSGQILSVPVPLLCSTPLPHRLESGSLLTEYVQAAHVVEASAKYNVPYSKMRPWVRLATGEQVYTKKGVLSPATVNHPA